MCAESGLFELLTSCCQTGIEKDVRLFFSICIGRAQRGCIDLKAGHFC